MFISHQILLLYVSVASSLPSTCHRVLVSIVELDQNRLSNRINCDLSTALAIRKILETSSNDDLKIVLPKIACYSIPIHIIREQLWPILNNKDRIIRRIALAYLCEFDSYLIWTLFFCSEKDGYVLSAAESLFWKYASIPEYWLLKYTILFKNREIPMGWRSLFYTLEIKFKKPTPKSGPFRHASFGILAAEGLGFFKRDVPKYEFSLASAGLFHRDIVNMQTFSIDCVISNSYLLKEDRVFIVMDEDYRRFKIIGIDFHPASGIYIPIR